MSIPNTINKYAASIGSVIPIWALALVMRLAIFTVFWKSVQTKISGFTVAGQHFKFWDVNDLTFILFESEYDLPVLPVELAAYLATFGEFFLSLGILFGFMTRLSALGLLAMTLVIQFFVYWDAWPTHMLWIAALLYLIRDGGGRLSVDHLLRRA